MSKHGDVVDVLHPGRRFTEDEERLVVVATAFGDLMANSWAQMLRNNGIPAVVKTTGPGFSLGGPPPAGFPVNLYVSAHFFERATAILEDFASPGELHVSEGEIDDE